MSSFNIPYTLPNFKLWRRETVELSWHHPKHKQPYHWLKRQNSCVTYLGGKKKKKKENCCSFGTSRSCNAVQFPTKCHPHAYTIMLIFLCCLDFSFCRISVQRFALSKIHSSAHTYTRPCAQKRHSPVYLNSHGLSCWQFRCAYAHRHTKCTQTHNLTRTHTLEKLKITQRRHLLRNLHN